MESCKELEKDKQVAENWEGRCNELRENVPGSFSESSGFVQDMQNCRRTIIMFCFGA